MKRVTKKQQRESEFKDAVYQALRDFQMFKIPKTDVRAGQLSGELTVVYDRIVKAAEKMTTKG